MSNSELTRRINLQRPSTLISIWSWLFNLTLYGILIYVAFNISRITIRARIAGESSLFASFPRLMLVGALILLLTSTFHELGHLFGGWLANLRFHLLVVGPLKISRESGKLRLGLSGGMALFNGLAASYPEKIYDLRRRMLLFAAGGPLASILLAAVAGAVYWWLRPGPFLRPQPVPAWVVESAAITAVSSFIFFLTSTKPGQYQNGMVADGGRILTLLQNREPATRWCSLIALNSADTQGVRPRDWDEKLVQGALVAQDGSQESLVGLLMAYRWARDSELFVQAATHLEAGLPDRPGLFQGVRVQLALEKAYLTAAYHQNAEEVRPWLIPLGRRSKNHPLSCRAETAVLLAEGKTQAAHQRAQDGLKALAAQPQTGSNLAEKAWLEELVGSAE
ncbi:MAG: M50 family metallopeptidase [Chloroflexota bacterium]